MQIRKTVVLAFFMGFFILPISAFGDGPKIYDRDLNFPRFYDVPHQSFEDSKGESFSFESLKGKIMVLDLIFTRCQGPCPLMSIQLKKLLEDLKEVKSLHGVSISIDPKYDQPKVLDEYGKKYGYGDLPWTFLTGDPKEVYSFARVVLKMASGDGAPDFHSTLFVLYDQEGRNRGYYNSKEPDAMKKLREDIRTLAKP